jgi:hypothetical protein
LDLAEKTIDQDQKITLNQRVIAVPLGLEIRSELNI